MPDFTKLAAVYEKARALGVSFSLTYQECYDMFSFEISSSAPSECWTGRDHSFDIAVECVHELMDSLKEECK